MRVFSILVWVGGLLVALPATAAMQTFGFACITPQTSANLVGACSAASSQLFVDITEQAQPDRVLFTFRNLAGGPPSSVTDVYFDDGTLLGIAAVIDGPGVAFSQGSSPPNLPGANNASPAFRTTAGFLADSDAPVSINGVNPGESLGILFSLQSGLDYADVLGAMSIAGGEGGLRIGLHVQAFEGFGGESVSLVNLPAPVPLPAPVVLMFTGMALLGWVGARRRDDTV